MEVPPLQEYYPSLDKMAAEQRTFYDFVRSELDEDRFVCLEGSISYAFVYIYSVIGEGATKGYSHSRAKLLTIASLYGGREEKVSDYCTSWAADCLLAEGKVEEWLDDVTPQDPRIPNSHTLDRISVRAHFGQDIPAWEWWHFFGPRKLNKIRDQNFDRWIELLSEEIGENADRQKPWHIRDLEVIPPNERPREWHLFSGVPLDTPQTTLPGYTRKHLKRYESEFKVLARNAENLLREELGLKPLKPLTVKKDLIIAFWPGIIREERDLPLPWVHYPGHYGSFFAFAESRESNRVYLCRCSAGAVCNYLALQGVLPPRNYADALRAAPLDSRKFPLIIAEGSLEDNDVVVEYRDGICHRCNSTPPTLGWCVPMYGGRFAQSYGWYIEQAYYRLGIAPKFEGYLSDTCPPEIQERIEEMLQATTEFEDEEARLKAIAAGPPREDIPGDEVTHWRHVRQEEAEPMIALRKRAISLRTSLKNDVENIVRIEFEHRKVGEAWVSETMLFHLVKRIYPDEEIIQHLRPDWLEGLELDIYLPGRKLAFEYQGQQHYHPIEAWGGQKAFDELQARDLRKKELCEANGVRLIEVRHSEPLVIDHIQSRVSESS